MKKNRLFTPGPTPVPDRVLQRMARPIIHHRTAEFEDSLTSVHHDLQYLFDTTQPVLVLAASGTGAMEAAIVNTLSSGDEIITVNGGKFGQRWGKIGRAYGLQVHEVVVPWGESISLSALERQLEAHPETKAICLTHSETSTGALTDVQGIVAALRPTFRGLFIVDGITAVGAHEMHFDEWDVDVLVTGSQKGLMIPPGLACIALSERAWRSVEQSDLPSFYFDLQAAKVAYQKGTTPWTPAVTLVLGLAEALSMIREEGREAVWERHSTLAEGLRRGVKALGVELLAESPSNALTSIVLPDGCSSLPGVLKEKYGYTIAGGQDDFKGKIGRISHLGYYDRSDMLGMLYVLEQVLVELRGGEVTGAGVAAASEYFGSSDVAEQVVNGGGV